MSLTLNPSIELTEARQRILNLRAQRNQADPGNHQLLSQLSHLISDAQLQYMQACQALGVAPDEWYVDPMA